MHHSISKILFVLDADEYLERLEGKIRKCLFFFMLKYSKIMWSKFLNHFSINYFFIFFWPHLHEVRGWFLLTIIRRHAFFFKTNVKQSRAKIIGNCFFYKMERSLLCWCLRLIRTSKVCFVKKTSVYI